MALWREHRNYRSIPSIMICRLEGSFPATIFDVGTDNFSFVTGHEVIQGDSITAQPADVVFAESALIYPGTIEWSGIRVRKGHRLYEARVAVPRLAQMDDFAWMIDTGYFCDMCGNTRGVRPIKHREGLIWLCPVCNDRINHLPEVLDEITEQFIIGNAL